MPAARLPRSAAVGDEALVDQAVEQIRQILSNTVAGGIEEVGQLLLQVFYNNDPALYGAASHSKHASLRILERRCETLELPIRRSFLGSALQLATFSRRLPRESAFRRLPASHRVELLKLKEPDRVEAIAAHVLASKLSVRRTRELVQRERAKSGMVRTRRRTPMVLRAIGESTRCLRDPTTGRLLFLREDVEELTEPELEAAQRMVEALSRRVEELRRLLG